MERNGNMEDNNNGSSFSRLLLVTQMSTLLLTIVTFHGETVMEEKGYYNDSGYNI